MKKSTYLLILVGLQLFVTQLLFSQHERKLLPQDTIYLKQIDSSNIKVRFLKPILPDSIPFNYQFTIENKKVNLKLIDRETELIINEYTEERTWLNNETDSFEIAESGHLVVGNRIFLFVGLKSKLYWNPNDSSLFEFYNSLFCFAIDSTYQSGELNYKSSYFGLIKNEFLKINPDGIARFDYQTIYGNPDWGYPVSCTVLYRLNFNKDSLEIVNKIHICNGSMITSGNDFYNDVGYVFYEINPEMQFWNLSCFNNNFEQLWALGDTPTLGNGVGQAASINHSNNYFIWNGYHRLTGYSTDYAGPYLYILDMQLGKIMDTLTLGFDINPYTLPGLYYGENMDINTDTNNNIYFRYFNKEGSKYYKIDYPRHAISSINIGLVKNNLTLVPICNSNIYGSNLRFYTNNNIFTIDSISGVITLADDFEHVLNTEHIVDYYINDGFGIDTIQITIDIIGSANEVKSEINIMPNPCSTFIKIDLNSKAPDCVASIADLSGKVVLKNRMASDGIINLDAMEPGIYLLKVENNKMIFTDKIMIIK